MSIKDLKENKLEDERIDSVTGGYPAIAITVTQYCKSCGHLWIADYIRAACPECGSIDVYTSTHCNSAQQTGGQDA